MTIKRQFQLPLIFKDQIAMIRAQRFDVGTVGVLFWT
jgi:hypothetical protein